MISLEKINYGKCQPPSFPFKKTCPCTILPPLFNFSDSPLQGRYLKCTPPPFKKSGEVGGGGGGIPNYVYCVSCTNNTHYGITDLVNHRIVKIKKLNTLRTDHNFSMK